MIGMHADENGEGEVPVLSPVAAVALQAAIHEDDETLAGTGRETRRTVLESRCRRRSGGPNISPQQRRTGCAAERETPFNHHRHGDEHGPIESLR